MLFTGSLGISEQEADFSCLETHSSTQNRRKLGCHSFKVSQKTYFLDFPLQQHSRVTCLAVSSLLHYFTSSILQAQRVLNASTGSSGVPSTVTHPSGHDALWHKPQGSQGKDTAQGGAEGSAQRQGELKRPHAACPTVAEKRNTWKLCTALNGGTRDNQLKQCFNKGLHLKKVLCWFLGMRYLFLVAKVNYRWGKLHLFISVFVTFFFRYLSSLLLLWLICLEILWISS